MSAESTIVSITTTIADAVITQEGFGTALIAGVLPAALVDDVYGPFSDASELLEAPYSLPVDHPVYLAAQALKSQSPAPSTFKVGNLKTAQDRTVKLTPATAPAEGDVYTWPVDGVTYTYTAGTTPTVASVVAGMLAAMSASTNGTPSDAGTHLLITQTAANIVAGSTFRVGACSSNLAVEDTSVGTGVSTDLAAIKSSDDASAVPGFFGISTTLVGKAQLDLICAWAEANKIIHLGASQDTAYIDGASTADVAYAAHGSGYHFSRIEYRPDPHGEPSHVGTMGLWFAYQPGEITLFSKPVAGSTALVLSTSQLAAIDAKKGDACIRVGGRGWIKNGWAASGRYLDVTRFVMWFDARFREGVLSYMANSLKIAQTDADLQRLQAVFDGVVAVGLRRNAIKPGTAVLTIPKIADMQQTDLTARLATGLSYTYKLAGAFQKFEIQVTVSA